jgi:ketosteroid isomerase-like protein
MKTKHLLILSLLAAFFASCSPAPEASVKLQSTDSLLHVWTNAWNARDVEAITTCYAADAITITDTVLTGVDAIKTGFILKAAPIFANLICQKNKEMIDNDLAYQSGSYTHDWMLNDTAVEKASGYYTMIWEKMEDNSWKMVLFQTN